MRIPEKTEDLIGKICVCSVGRAFLVVGKQKYAWGDAWVGLGFDGKGTACSSNPCVVAENAAEFWHKLSSRFDGKMSYNS